MGKKLFFDTSLSSRGNQSCASCHDPNSGFADPDATREQPVSEGSEENAFGNRNAPTAAYASFIPNFSRQASTTADGTSSQYRGGQFLDGRAIDLEAQAGAPFLNPVEMNNAGKADVVSKVSLAPYADEFRQLFGATIFDDTEQAYAKIVFAIAVFEASSEMNPFSSKFDAVMAGNAEFSPSEQRGFELFQSDQTKCANCHTLNTPPQRSLFTDFNYFNVGTPANPNHPAGSGFIDGGLGDSTRTPVVADADLQRGKFRTPTLRNVELTAPYMHNGVYATLEEVIDHYDFKVANFDGPGLGFEPEVTDNMANELNMGTYMVLGLSPQDRTDLVNFMLTLTDGYE